MKKKIVTFIALFLPSVACAAVYDVPLGTKTVDGDTYCGGSTCTSSDTIRFLAGTRTDTVLLRDFDGNGSYITVTNEDSASDVPVHTGVDGTTTAMFTIYNCKYVDIRGDGDPDVEYGFTINNGSFNYGSAIQVMNESDHFKISYFDITHVGNTANAGAGLKVQDASLPNTWIFDDFEIHHNRIDGAPYAGMYIGHNYSNTTDDPYIKDYDIYNNIIINTGGYGFNTKSAWGGTGNIYNNTVWKTGLNKANTAYTSGDTSQDNYTDHWRAGIRPNLLFNNAVLNVHDNDIRDTIGACIDSSFGWDGSGVVNIYDNILAGCGSGQEETTAHGIVCRDIASLNVYDNKIIQPEEYGLYIKGNCTAWEQSANEIGDAGVGVLGSNTDPVPDIITTNNANIEYTDVASFNFVDWTDDSNYLNDDYTVSTSTESIVIGRVAIGGAVVKLVND